MNNSYKYRFENSEDIQTVKCFLGKLSKEALIEYALNGECAIPFQDWFTHDMAKELIQNIKAEIAFEKHAAVMKEMAQNIKESEEFAEQDKCDFDLFLDTVTKNQVKYDKLQKKLEAIDAEIDRLLKRNRKGA